MATPQKTKTDRERFSEPLLGSGLFQYAFLMNGYGEDFADGLKGFAAAWFATYEDEDDLPAWFRVAIKQAEEIGLDFTLPGLDDDEEAEEAEVVVEEAIDLATRPAMDALDQELLRRRRGGQ